MNNQEARQVLHQHLKQYRQRSYADLVQMVDKPGSVEILGPSGTKYQVEIQAVWDDRTQTNLRVLGSIDDGGWRAFMPLSDDFIVAPDGSFVGE